MIEWVELIGRDELGFERILIAPGDPNRFEEAAGEPVVFGGPQPRTCPMRPIFVNDETAPGHHVAHAVDNHLWHEGPPAKAATLGVALGVLRPQAMQYETITFAVAARTLSVISAAVRCGAFRRTP